MKKDNKRIVYTIGMTNDDDDLVEVLEILKEKSRVSRFVRQAIREKIERDIQNGDLLGFLNPSKNQGIDIKKELARLKDSQNEYREQPVKKEHTEHKEPVREEAEREGPKKTAVEDEYEEFLRFKRAKEEAEKKEASQSSNNDNENENLKKIVSKSFSF